MVTASIHCAGTDTNPNMHTYGFELWKYCPVSVNTVPPLDTAVIGANDVINIGNA